MSKLTATQVLDTNYLNTYYKGNVSNDDPTRNITNLQFTIENNKLYINWTDASNPNWKTNVICKSKNQIPATAFETEMVVGKTTEVNYYKDNTFIDANVQPDTLYCYRIFTEFEDMDEFYSGFKNMFFIYVYDSKAYMTSQIDANLIISNPLKRFVTDAQIESWNNKADQETTYSKDEVNDLILNNNVMEKLNKFVFPDIYDKPIITFIEDDGRNSFLNVTKPVYDEKGIKVTLGITNSNVDKTQYLTLSEIQQIVSEGHSIISHGFEHKDVANFDDDKIKEDFKNSKKWFDDNNFDVNTIAYPFANFDLNPDLSKDNSVRIKTLAKKYFTYGINSDGGSNTSPIDSLYINRIFIDKTEYTLEDIKEIINKAIDNNEWLIFGVHSWSATQMSTTFISAIIDYIQSKKIDILPFNEAIKIKANIISIGEFTNNKKGFFIGNDGNVINRSENLQIVDSEKYTFDYGLEYYIKDKMSLVNIKPENDTLNNIGGTLLTYNKNNEVGCGIFTSNKCENIFIRYWNPTDLIWSNWIDITNSSYNIVPGVYQGDMNDPISKFNAYNESVLHISAAKDTLTHGGGVLKVYYGDTHFSYEMYYPINNSTIYKRLWNHALNNWDAWKQIGGGNGSEYRVRII